MDIKKASEVNGHDIFYLEFLYIVHLRNQAEVEAKFFYQWIDNMKDYDPAAWMQRFS